jgi:hypothetical protein
LKQAKITIILSPKDDGTIAEVSDESGSGGEEKSTDIGTGSTTDASSK